MKILLEKGLNATVYALLFVSIAFVLDTLAPLKPTELYELYMTYAQALWFIAILFAVISGTLVIIAIGTKIGLLVDVNEYLRKRHIALGFVINGFGFLCVVLFLSQYIVFPW
ncbi:MAG: hypothetical protein ABW098_02905 [Candidatus Thiodiazotropha sp.]